MEELRKLLTEISDSYYDFVKAILRYAEKKQSRLDAVLEYIKANPQATSSDIVEFVSDQPDFYEDAAVSKVG